MLKIRSRQEEKFSYFQKCSVNHLILKKITCIVPGSIRKLYEKLNLPYTSTCFLKHFLF